MTFHLISIVLLTMSALSFVVIALHVATHKQHMAVMNFVWPITALYFGPFALWTYCTFGTSKQRADRPFGQKVWTGVTHRGAGCILGDVLAEWLVFLTGFTVFPSPMWGG